MILAHFFIFYSTCLLMGLTGRHPHDFAEFSFFRLFFNSNDWFLAEKGLISMNVYESFPFSFISAYGFDRGFQKHSKIYLITSFLGARHLKIYEIWFLMYFRAIIWVKFA